MKYIIIDQSEIAFKTDVLTDEMKKDAYPGGPILYIIDVENSREFYEGKWSDIKSY